MIECAGAHAVLLLVDDPHLTSSSCFFLLTRECHKISKFISMPLWIILFLSVVVYLIVLPLAPDTYERKLMNPVIYLGDE